MTNRPHPNPADIAAAEAFVRERYDNDPDVCRTWLKNHRASMLDKAARIEMQKRLEAEFHAAMARFDESEARCAEALATLPAIRADMRKIFEESTDA